MTDRQELLSTLAAKFGQGSIVTNQNVFDTAAELGHARPHWFFNQHVREGRGRWRLRGQAQSEARVASESPAEVASRVAARFRVMDRMVDATIGGKNRAVIVSGPPGVGKSHGVLRALSDLDESRYAVVKGFVRPTGLYKTLYDHRESGHVVVFDDADSIFFDDVSLNILKAACDSTRARRLSWLAETRMEDESGDRLPRSFEFRGSVVFLTNYDFDSVVTRGGKLAPHFEAMISRSHYVDLALKTPAEYLARIRQVVAEGMLDDTDVSQAQRVELLEFLDTNHTRLRELSLRMVVKLADLMTVSPKDWRELALVTCCKK
jgi:hypothetical protein